MDLHALGGFAQQILKQFNERDEFVLGEGLMYLIA